MSQQAAPAVIATAIAFGAYEKAPDVIYGPENPGDIGDHSLMVRRWMEDKEFRNGLNMPIRRSMFLELWPDAKSVSVRWRDAARVWFYMTLHVEAPFSRIKVYLPIQIPSRYVFADRQSGEAMVEAAWGANEPMGMLGPGDTRMTPEQLVALSPDARFFQVLFRYERSTKWATLTEAAHATIDSTTGKLHRR